MNIREIIEAAQLSINREPFKSDDEVVAFLRDWGPFEIPFQPRSDRILFEIDRLLNRHMYLEEFLVEYISYPRKNTPYTYEQDENDFMYYIDHFHDFWKEIKVKSGEYKPMPYQAMWRLREKYRFNKGADFFRPEYIRYKADDPLYYFDDKQNQFVHHLSEMYDNGVRIQTYGEFVNAVKFAKMSRFMDVESEFEEIFGDSIPDKDVKLTWCQALVLDINNGQLSERNALKAMVEKPDVLEDLINTILEPLTDLHKSVILARYRDCKTYNQIGQDINKSQARARGICMYVLRKLRSPKNIRCLNDFAKKKQTVKVSEWDAFDNLELTVRTHNTIKRHIHVYYIHDLLTEFNKSSTVADLYKRFGKTATNEVFRVLQKVSLINMLSDKLRMNDTL